MQAALTRIDANQLMFEGSLALSKVQSNGMKIDTDHCERARRKIELEMAQINTSLLKLKEVKEWRRKYGERFNLGSDDQLSYILFDYLGLESKKETSGGKPSVDVNALEELLEETQNPLLKGIMRLRKLDKAHGTYLGGILREVDENGFLHPFFALNTAVTYRSSSYSINFQNIPTRDDEIKKLIRTAFLPRPGRQILEVDFKGIEVCVAYCYHQDPTMYAYLTDPTKDMHRDMAQQIYILNDKEWNKKSRHAAKNKFVFPEFYGSYFKQVAPDLWKAIVLNKLHVGKDNDGIVLTQHLKKKGIKSYKDFEKHIQDIEDNFWNVRFPVYAQWKEDWLAAYHENGYFDSLSGFRFQGIFKRNEVINYAVQGAAFHCLLWTLIQLQKWLERRGMKSLIIGQIHDSIVMDIVPEEKDEILQFLINTITHKLPMQYPWLTIPMSIEAELAGIDEPWLNKKEISLAQYAA